MFSTTFRYGLISLLELARSDDLLQAGAIAARHNLSQHYLSVVLADLRRLGLVQSQKGKNGGYRLLCDPHQVNLLALYRALAGGGDAALLDPESEDPEEGLDAAGIAPGPSALSAATGSQAAELWLRRVSRRWAGELAATSLADLLA